VDKHPTTLDAHPLWPDAPQLSSDAYPVSRDGPQLWSDAYPIRLEEHPAKVARIKNRFHPHSGFY